MKPLPRLDDTDRLVLLVDDEPTVARAHARMLRRYARLGTEVCCSPLRALERIAAGERFDAVVCDGQMPGLDGVAFFLRASAFWPDLEHRFVFLSGGLRGERREFVGERCLISFTKPLHGEHREAFVAVVRGLAHLPHS
ncbi:MAG TPA: response regulator [Polyangiaceae bacterium]|jgi:CheY-like chemotaxis protein